MKTNISKPAKTRQQRVCRPAVLYKLVFLTVVVVSFVVVCVTIFRTNDKRSETLWNTSAENEILEHERLRSISELINVPSEEESKTLYNQVRVLCLVVTMPSNHVSKARHVRATWGRRCNKLLFMSSTSDSSLNTVNLNVTEGRNALWEKTQNAFKYVYENNLDDADWFLKADDDTYVIVENLRNFLRNHSGLYPVYFGYHFYKGSLSGGAGYVLSRRAVEMFVENGLRSGSCPNVSEAEDVQMDACLKAVGVTTGDSRDSEGRDRFFPFVPVESLLASYEYYYDAAHPFNKTEAMRCSDTAISFHYVKPGDMYVMEYFIYHLKLKGGAYPEFQPVAYPLGDQPPRV